MLELIFQGFLEWAYGLALECWQYFSTALLDIMSMDFAYLKSHAPVVDEIMQILLAVGWALLIGNLVFQALKSMAVGLGFEGEDPKLLFARTFVFAFLLLASPQICEIGLSMTSKIIELLQIPDAVNVTFVDESVFGAIGAAWLLVIIFGIIVMFKVFKLLLEIAERYVILAMLTITAPLAFAMGGSKSTSEIFTGWCRMFGSMCLLMVTNVIFFKMLLSVLATVPSGLDVLPWIVLILTIVKVARKADVIVTRIGLNPAITGDSLGRGLPGTLTYRQDMQLEEISLDCVIMSPEMLEPVPAREPESIGNQLTLTCLEDQIDHVDGVTLAISNDMGVLLRKMLENLEEYDDPPVLTRVEKTISGFLFAYGGRDNQEDGPCVVYIVSETPVLPAKNKEEMK